MEYLEHQAISSEQISHGQALHKLGSQFPFQDTSSLAMRSGCMECIIREGTEIELNPNNMNRKKVSPRANMEAYLVNS